MIFGPTTLHGDAIKIKCAQMGIIDYEEYFNKIMERIQFTITKSNYITEKDLEDIIIKTRGSQINK